MPRLIFKNNFEVALAQPTTTSDTTITIRSGSGFPTLGANERVVATIVDAATGLQFEIVTVTAVVGNVLTVQRAQEGTAARAWAAGDMLSIRTTASSLTNTVRNFGLLPSGINLNSLTGTWFGQYYQYSNAAAQTSLNYPVALEAGILEVLQTAISLESCIQRYTTFNSNNLYQRRYNAETSSWSPWAQMYSSQSTIPIANGGTGQTTIQGMKDAFGFGPVADQSIVPTSMGGTGSADNAQAWLNIRPQGSTPLAGDPVNDYDAATKRWVENLVSTGTVGPSMNGVMNYGVGDFHLRDSRAYIQPYEVVADGQLLNRADWPELWAYAQMLTPIADADWLADPLKRGKYSLGNGTTTFRVPDRNGVQTGSVRALFARGDGGNSSIDGTIMESFVPNIIGAIGFHGSQTNGSGATVLASASGSAYVDTAQDKYVNASTLYSSAAKSWGTVRIDASRSNAVYGRNNLQTDEVLPRNFTGVWVIRASGGFTAANTQWSVVNGDTTMPGPGTTADGGSIMSEYRVGTAVEAEGRMRVRAVIGGAYYMRLTVTNLTTAASQAFDFVDNGNLLVPNNLITSSGNVDAKGQLITRGGQATFIGNTNNQSFIDFKNSANTATYGRVYSERNGDVTIMTTTAGGVGTNKYFQFLQAGNAVCSGGWGTSSDVRIKDEIVKIQDPLTKMKGINGVSWRLKTDGAKVGFGFVAQDVEVDFPEAVSVSGDMELSDGTVVKDVKSVDTYGVAAALHHEAILALMDQIDELKAEIVALKAAK